MHSCLKLAFNATNWVPSRTEWIFAGKLIQVEERKRISEFHYKNDAKLCLAGRLLLRYAVTSYTGIKWRDLTLIRSDKGKPLLGPTHASDVISFNASHQGDFVVVAADRCDVGVDVMDARECHGDVEEFFRLMTRQFTKEEWESIRGESEPSLRMREFYRHWCLKESYVKAIGAGISHPLLSLSFRTKSPLAFPDEIADTSLFKDGKLELDWRFEESTLDRHHIATVARKIRCQDAPSSFEILTFDQVTSNAQTLGTHEDVDALFNDCFDNPFKQKRKQLTFAE